MKEEKIFFLYKNINPEEILVFSGFFFVGQGVETCHGMSLQQEKRKPFMLALHL
jgi:hypothetical protein